MQQLLDNFKAHLHWVVFLLLEAVSLVLLFRLNPYQHSLWFSRATRISGYVNEQNYRLRAYLDLGEENRRLVRQNILLQLRLEQMRHLITHERQDTAVLTELNSLKQEGMRLIPARISSNSIVQRDNIMLIDHGSQDGIRPEMGVLCGTGIVGIVAQVGKKYATVLPLLNSRSSISCRIRGSNYFGYLHWNGGSPLTALLDDIPHHAQIKIGDIIETSGYSNIFPAGIFVGRVTRIGNSSDGLAKQLEVRLGADLSNIQEVMVVEHLGRTETDMLLNSKNKK